MSNPDGYAPWAVQIKRNVSYRASLKLAVNRVIGYAPLSWWSLNGTPLQMLLLAIPQVILFTLLWLSTTVALVVAGLFGCLSEPSPQPPAAENGEGPQEGLGV